MGKEQGLEEIVAFVPMRHHSERVPGKNYRDFQGRPLFHHIVETLLGLPEIARIVVDTDSPIIRDSCREHFPGVACIDRPEHLRDGRIPMTEILRRDAELFPAGWYLQTHSTNPLLSVRTIRDAIERLRKTIDVHDSLFSVTRHQARFYRANGDPINHDPTQLLRTQDLEPIDEENSCLYLFTAAQIGAGRRFGDSPLLHPVPLLEAIDIDTEDDFRLAEAGYGVLGRAVG